MKVKLTPIMIQGLNEGDLFSSGDQAWWNNTLNTDARAIKVMYKTSTPYPIEDKDKQVYKVEFVSDEKELDDTILATPVELPSGYSPYGNADSD